MIVVTVTFVITTIIICKNYSKYTVNSIKKDVDDNIKKDVDNSIKKDVNDIDNKPES